MEVQNHNQDITIGKTFVIETSILTAKTTLLCLMELIGMIFFIIDNKFIL